MPKKKKPFDRIRGIQRILNIRFRNAARLNSALVHSSFWNESGYQEASDFQRLEFFGDAVLNLAVCEKLLKQFPNANEGTLSRLRSTLVSKRILSLIARKLSLGRFLVLGKGEHFQQPRQKSRLLADTLEALIGALYLDRGMGTTRAFIWKQWGPYFDERKIAQLDPNPKSMLQEVAQKNFHILPLYQTKPTAGGFRAIVQLKRKWQGAGKGVSKQEAEAEAAKKLLRVLKSKKIIPTLGKLASKA